MSDSNLPVTHYRVVCLTCDPGGTTPFYEGPDEHTAIRYYTSGLRRPEHHNMQVQKATFTWETLRQSDQNP